ncbi:hypothetical protein [Pseudomonas sp.]|uniref:hypothetical protein n=1 Tax=Pseudomonas sp. TaxID=306 RepID=UPI00290EE219|nr:hypothetical protein [Pseudomonas sp.]MDU4254579.1 hypothetical protein [Pseudomonas sp.]
MDIRSFLASGTTHVHTKEPQGNFARSAKAMVLALALGVPAAASAQSADQANPAPTAKVSQMPYAGDTISLFYQALVAPQANDQVRVVSTRSGAMLSMLHVMPERLQKALNTTPDNVSMAVRNADASPFALTVRLTNENMMGTSHQSVCMVNALESVSEHIEYRNGTPHLRLAQLNAVHDPFTEMAAMSKTEGAQLAMVHELSHCEYNVTSIATDGFDPADALEGVFRTSYNEAAADLGMILYYASKEGTFANGRVAIGAARAGTLNTDHTTMGMLDLVLAKLNPADFKGMPVNEVFKAVTPIMNDAFRERSAELRKAFLKEFAEGTILHGRLSGESDKAVLNPELQEELVRRAPGFTYNPYAMASDKIDMLLDNGLRNPDFQRQLGLITVAKVEDAARVMGVQLSPEQVIKARFLDPQFSPPGTKGEVGLPGVSQLREVNYMPDLERQAINNLQQHIKDAPRFN